MNPCVIVIPSYNEEENIGKVLEGLLAENLPADILVVNDGSIDRTAELASLYPVTVVTHPCNLGYGAALQTGFKYAFSGGYRYLIQFDADDQHDPKSVQVIMKMMEDGSQDIVMGSRYLQPDGFHAGKLKKAAVAFFRWLIYSLTKFRVSDPTSGLRGVSHRVFSYYAIRDRLPADFPDADILIQMILKGYKIAEVPVKMRERHAGVSMHAGLKPVFYMMKIMLSILIVVLTHRLSKKVPKHG